LPLSLATHAKSLADWAFRLGVGKNSFAIANPETSPAAKPIINIPAQKPMKGKLIARQ
jgi:hypothetical protein